MASLPILAASEFPSIPSTEGPCGNPHLVIASYSWERSNLIAIR
jgi:hypothetical protein